MSAELRTADWRISESSVSPASDAASSSHLRLEYAWVCRHGGGVTGVINSSSSGSGGDPGGGGSGG